MNIPPGIRRFFSGLVNEVRSALPKLRFFKTKKFLVPAVAALILIPGFYFLLAVGQAVWLYQKNRPYLEVELDKLTALLAGKSTQGIQPAGEERAFFEPGILDQTTAIPSRIYDRNGRIVGEFSRSDSRFIRDLREVPPFLVKALLLTEDRRFYEHHGYSLRGIARAMLANLIHLEIRQGGSTVTQQLAKILFTARERLYSRKLFELFCARAIETRFTKDEILLLYFNFAYFGHGNYGVEHIAGSFFQKDASQLSAVECAHLVSVLANPTVYSPFLHPEWSRRRHQVVMDLLVKEGVLTESYAKREFRRHWDGLAGGSLSMTTSIWNMRINRAPHFVESLRRRLERLFPNEEIQKGGYAIHTSLDLDYQDVSQAVLRRGLASLNHQFPQLKKDERIEGALIVLDNETGGILSAVGGSGFSINNQLIRYDQIHRPIGSLVKPFIYLLAAEKLGYDADTVLVDKPFKVGSWEPKNYDRLYLTNVTMARALILSRNIPAIRTLDDLSFGSFFSLFREGAGVMSGRIPRNLASALGSFDLSPLEAARMYALFPREGKPLSTADLFYIEGPSGEVVYDNREIVKANSTHSPNADGLVSKKSAHLLTEILIRVCRDPSGTAFYATSSQGLGLIAAGGKTGTTQNYKDSWFAGFTPDITCVVWIGVDANVALEGAGGGKIAAPLWVEAVRGIYQYLPPRDFPFNSELTQMPEKTPVPDGPEGKTNEGIQPETNVDGATN
ncbi:MAG: transglycosylase domain-containing protein [Spirochaetia bacterium]|nr:transglycosylase domain-containing protein [Spirochaetia bacterium]